MASRSEEKRIKDLVVRISRLEAILASRTIRAPTITGSLQPKNVDGIPISYEVFIKSLPSADITTLEDRTTGPYTIFAPTDNAMREGSTLSVIAVKGSLTLSNLIDQTRNGQSVTLTTISGKTFKVGSTDNSVIVLRDDIGNLSTIINPDIVYDNGIIHGTNSPLDLG